MTETQQAGKQNPEKTFAFLIDNHERAKQTDVSYREVEDVEGVEVGDNIVGSVFMDIYVFKEEFVDSLIRKELEKDMDSDTSYTILVLNVETNLDLQQAEELLYKVLTEEDATLGTYQYSLTTVGAYAFRSDSR